MDQSIFNALNSTDLESLSFEKSCRLYERSEPIFHEGSYSDGLYCIHDGKIKITRMGPNGRETIIRFATGGDTIGYTALVSGEQLNVSAVALEPTQVCRVPRESIFRLIRANPSLTMNIMQLMSHELEESERRVVELAQKSVKERVAEALLVLKETFGYEADGETISIHLTREELADVVGTATESVIRMLSEFKHLHIIETEGTNIRIKNVTALIRVANLSE
ncbi:Crp/Fnr family transcriptional regulator [soil metagenome]